MKTFAELIAEQWRFGNRHQRREAAALKRGKGGWGWRVKKQRIGEGRRIGS